MDFWIKGVRIAVNMPDRQALFEAICTRLNERRGFSVATLNLDHLVKMRQSEAFRHAYTAQDLVVADGNPVVWLSRLARAPVALVPGSDLVVPLAQMAAARGIPVALLGSTETSLERAALALQQAAPGLEVVARIAPPFGFDPQGAEGAAALQMLDAAGARLCLLALGAPKQEILAARGRALCPAIGFVSIGAGLDFLAGTQRRAPAWVRAMTLEWAWRMLSQPRRLLPRYARCAAILPAEIIAALSQRRTNRTR